MTKVETAAKIEKAFPVTRGEILATTILFPIANVASQLTTRLVAGYNDNLGFPDQNIALKDISDGLMINTEAHPVAATIDALSGIALFMERLNSKVYPKDSLLKAEMQSSKAYAIRYFLQHAGLLLFASHLNTLISGGDVSMPSAVESTVMVLGAISSARSTYLAYDYLVKITRLPRHKRLVKQIDQARVELANIRSNKKSDHSFKDIEAAGQRHLDYLISREARLNEKLIGAADGIMRDSDNEFASKYPLGWNKEDSDELAKRESVNK